MLDPILAVASERPPDRIVDCTIGGAGHAHALLSRFSQAKLIGLDRDLTAVNAARACLSDYADRVTILHTPFAELSNVLDKLSISGADLLLADFGVSSHQLDEPQRGFSFRSDAPLDMRMDPSSGITAAQLIDTASLEELTQILKALGEERYARRIAKAMVAERPKTTFELRELVRRVVPSSSQRIHPATRTFQALRMAVNDELGQIEALMRQLPKVLRQGGTFLALSFHSLEDRAVKLAIRNYGGACTCPPFLPICHCGAIPVLRARQGKPLKPSPVEIAQNPRARSARLRVAYRVGVVDGQTGA